MSRLFQVGAIFGGAMFFLGAGALMFLVQLPGHGW